MTGAELPRARRSTQWVIGALAAILVAVPAVFMASRWGGRTTVVDVDDIAQGIAATLGSVVALAASRRHSGRSRLGWRWLAGGLALWALGQAVWCWYEIGQGHSAPFPSVADIGFLGFSLCATVAVSLIGTDRRSNHAPQIIDGLIVAGALLIISWITALGATVRGGGGLTFSILVSLAYPVTDVILLTMTVQMLSRLSSARRSLILLGVGAVALAGADSSFTYLSAIGRYHTGDPLDLGWIGGFGLMAVAAATSRIPPTERRGLAQRKQLVFLPYAVLVIAGVVMAALLAAGHHMDSVEAVMVAVVVLLVLGRQYLAIRDNQQLMRTVEAREAQLSHQAFHDNLTGLPNRALFNDRVAHALDLHRQHRRLLAVLFCDLDDFKVINDTLGHKAGDELLVRFGERLRAVVSPGDTLSRLGGDEFAVLVESKDPCTLAARMTDMLREPFLIEGRATTVRISIGIRIVSDREPTPTSAVLLSDADTAMYAAKRGGKAGVQVYDPGMRESGTDDLDLRQALTDALVGGEMRAVFQPIVDPATGRVTSLEALARWERDGSPVEPSLFVPLAEQLGLVHLLTDYMLDAASAQLDRWSSLLGHHELKVAVNVSATELGDDDFLERIATALSRYAISSDQLILEITESAVASEPEAAGAKLRALRALGLHIALDDFGSGQSSLSRLQEFPINYLKLDGEMVGQIDKSETQAFVVASVVELARHLGMKVIAEGVENTAQLDVLCAMKPPPLVQGFVLARPVPAADLTGVLIGGVLVPAATLAAATPAAATLPASPFPAATLH